MTLFFDLLTKLMRWTLTVQADGSALPDEQAASESSLMDQLWTYGRYVVLLAVLALIVELVRRSLDLGGPKLKATVDRDTRKEIRACYKEEDFIGAGEAAYRAGAYEDAAAFYLEGKDFIRAADAFLNAGKRSEAVTYFKRGGQNQRAAQILEQAGQFRMAATEFLNAGDINRASQLFMKGKDFRRAAELFTEMGLWKDAGEAFERLSLREEAADAYEKYFNQEYQLVRGKLRKLPREPKDKARFAAQIFQENGEIDRSAKLLRRSGHIEDAAQLLIANERYNQAAELYLKAKRPLEAAQIYESQGDQQKASIYRGEAAMLKGDLAEAAMHFADAGEYMKAADLYVDQGERIKAGEMYEAAKDFRYAAEQYALAEDYKRAAKCFEESGDYYRAADLFHRIDDLEGEVRALQRLRAYFRLGKLMLEHGRTEEALAALQKVDKVDPNFAEASEIQGDILRDMGRKEVALGKYRQAMGEAGTNANNISVSYKLANCMEQSGDLAEAQRIYEHILAIDYYFEDTQSRVENIRARLTQNNPPMSGSMRAMGPVSGSIRSPLSRPNGTLRYEIIDEIARGGMGIVYRAKDTVLNRVVAYKLLSENLKTNPTAVKYFLREARAAASLSHQNIVTVYDAGEQNNEYYMAMELVHGETLKSLITRSGPFHEKLIRFILVHSCRGLSYAHSQGIVHRDNKSGNMMLTRDKTLKIMDFGLAKFIEEYQSQHTKAIGTPFYMSPEQILGRSLDHRSDLYSLGVTLFECATGTVPFFKGELSYHHLHTKPPSPRSLNPNLSTTMERIILTLLEKNPKNRFQSANDILKHLKAK